MRSKLHTKTFMKVNSMGRKTYINGIPGKKWGICNSRAKSFQFGSCEDTPEKAEFALFQQIGKDSYKSRFYSKMMSFRDIVQIKMEKEAYRLRLRRMHPRDEDSPEPIP